MSGETETGMVDVRYRIHSHRLPLARVTGGEAGGTHRVQIGELPGG
jgi:hypothetical protein